MYPKNISVAKKLFEDFPELALFRRHYNPWSWSLITLYNLFNSIALNFGGEGKVYNNFGADTSISFFIVHDSNTLPLIYVCLEITY